MPISANLVTRRTFLDYMKFEPSPRKGCDNLNAPIVGVSAMQAKALVDTMRAHGRNVRLPTGMEFRWWVDENIRSLTKEELDKYIRINRNAFYGPRDLLFKDDDFHEPLRNGTRNLFTGLSVVLWEPKSQWSSHAVIKPKHPDDSFVVTTWQERVVFIPIDNSIRLVENEDE